MSPKYPLPGSPGSPTTKQRKLLECESFEKRHQQLNSRIATKCSYGGNLVFSIDFFREGTSYYKVTENIDTVSLSITEIASLPFKEKILILMTLANSVKILHDLHIVHGDLKPDNILIKRTTTGNLVAKLIDFDDSFLEGEPPKEREQLAGTPEYYSPELARYIMDEDEVVDGSTISCQSDIFALGIIFSEYLTGKKPKVSTTYIWQSEKIKLDGKDVPKSIISTISNMLSAIPENRPSIKEVLEVLRKYQGKNIIPTTIPPASTGGKSESKLRGTLLGKKK